MPINTTGQPIYIEALLDWGLPTPISWTGNYTLSLSDDDFLF